MLNALLENNMLRWAVDAQLEVFVLVAVSRVSTKKTKQAAICALTDLYEDTI